MTVIKKSGKKEAFSTEKLMQSIAAASDEAKEPLNESDLKILLAEFQMITKEKNLITSQQIDIIVNGLLYSRGFHGVLAHYVSYTQKR